MKWVYFIAEDIKTSRLVAGDKNSKKVLECIAFTTVLYGEQVVLIQCMPIIIDMVSTILHCQGFSSLFF